MPKYKPIRDYAIIGNRRSAALVAKDGTIDWTPAPFLDSPSVFAALLDYTKGGFWAIQPIGKFESIQEYMPETNILVTRFTTKQGVMELIDCLPIKNGNGNGSPLGTFQIENSIKSVPLEKDEIFEIQRKVVCKEGQCDIKIFFQPRFDYARGTTKLSLVDGGVIAEKGDLKGILISNATYEIQEVDADIETQQRAVAYVSFAKGQQHYLTFRYNTTEIASQEDAYYEHTLQETKQFWEEWVRRCDLETCPIEYPWHEAVIRSSLVLKILFFEPPGSIAAAATTSLPEEIGGERNWDYRFSWVRDSAFTLQALFWLGYIKEADEYIRWLIGECREAEDGPENLQIMYGLRGQKNLTEQILGHFDGYMGSKPIRVGNAAFSQKQWDVYGGILNMVWRLHRMRKDYKVSPKTWVMLRAFANYVVKIWREPDEGLWEVRGGKRHFVHSKVMCWVALDRILKLGRAYGFEEENEVWERERDAIRKEIMGKGWSAKQNSFVQSFGSEDLDASSLLMPVLGFIDGRDPKMISTIRAIENTLAANDGLLYRYKSADGLAGGEGAFFLCSFWLVDALVFAGERESAQQIFETLLSYRNHVGLLSEEIAPETKDFLGNFPQAYAHIGLINSAFYLSFDEETLKKIIS
ncbi:MAG: glycoside hydrolase family 15 protein [Candidatus Wildermuthbacteria bacterium]|nr:glycoside hydrolase family 15 protein [Candidatus Wildermuthbacteria bacterium]